MVCAGPNNLGVGEVILFAYMADSGGQELSAVLTLRRQRQTHSQQVANASSSYRTVMEGCLRLHYYLIMDIRPVSVHHESDEVRHASDML
jgi:hypothetical protein